MNILGIFKASSGRETVSGVRNQNPTLTFSCQIPKFAAPPGSATETMPAETRVTWKGLHRRRTENCPVFSIFATRAATGAPVAAQLTPFHTAGGSLAVVAVVLRDTHSRSGRKWFWSRNGGEAEN